MKCKQETRDTDRGNKSGNLCGGFTVALIRDSTAISVTESRNCKGRRTRLAHEDLTLRLMLC